MAKEKNQAPKEERVWLVRPGQCCVDEGGAMLPDRTFPEDSPVPKLPANQGLCRLIVRAVPPEEYTFRQAAGLPAEPEPVNGEDYED